MTIQRLNPPTRESATRGTRAMLSWAGHGETAHSVLPESPGVMLL